jgi:MFS family permease
MNKLEERKLNSNIWKAYLYKALFAMFFSVPAMVLFWQENGLSLMSIMILQALFALFVAILEIPTGYFADKYGRKKSLILAGVFAFAAISWYSLGHTFLDFLVGEFLIALAVSLISGTMAALIFDTLQELGREKEYQKIWGNALFYGLVTLAIAGILGGFIAKIDLRYTLFASIPFFALLAPLAFSMVEPERKKVIFKGGYLKQLFKIFKEYLTSNDKKSKKLKWIIIYSAVIFAFNQSVLWLYQPYFKITGVDVIYFGVIFAGFQMVSALASKYAHKLERYFGEKYFFAMLIFLVAVSYLLMSNFLFLFSFSFCFIQQFVRGLKNVVVSDYVNRLVGSEIRATILSAENFLGKILYAIIAPIFGWIADVYSLTQALMVMGVVALIFGVMFLISFKISKVL